MTTAIWNKQASRKSSRGSSSISRFYALDPLLLFLGIGLLSFGLLMVTSASLHLGDRFDIPFYYTWKHMFSIFLGVMAGLIVMKTPTNLWQKYSVHLYVIGLILLLLVFVPGVGKTVNGATRWIPLGLFNLQSSEFMKLFIVLYMAGYLVRRQIEVRHSIQGFINPMLLIGLACSIILLQPDFGTTTVIVVTVLGMLFLGGAPLWQFILLIGLLGSSFAMLIIFSPYRLARVTGFLDPWADVNGSGYQLAQALIAFGRGEWSGVGLGNGIQKQFYLPEAHTDFLMAIIGEEFGLIGTVVVILMLSLLIWKAFQIGTSAMLIGRRFAAYVAYGLAVWIGYQSFVNIGVNVGLLPTKGITLPFMSYGGNSIIVACIVLAMLLKIDQENRELTQPSKRNKAWRVA